MPESSSPPSRLSGDFKLYVAGNFLSVLGAQMQLATVEWEIYERTGNPLSIGLVGLIQFLPVVLLTLPAGHVVDNHDRRRVVMGSALLMLAAAVGLALISWSGADHRLIYVCVLATGAARAFHQPAKASLVPQLVPLALFSRAVSWNTGAFQLAAVVGPAAGGLLLARLAAPALVYVLNIAALVAFISFLARLRPATVVRQRRATSLAELLGGLAHLRRSQVLLGAITLDLFAVLLGGAVAMLPIYAKDPGLLAVGPTGYGALRAAPGVGALVTSLVLARGVAFRRSGHVLLASVAGFGLATIVFGVSRSYPLSLAMLALTGAFDMISVVIRHTLVQTQTPDELRGRVSAINGLFIGASNELGAFESSIVAWWWSPTVSVVSGGAGTIAVVLLTAAWLPALRRHGPLDE